MNHRCRSTRLAGALQSAEHLARVQGSDEVTSTHLLLAVMAQLDSCWPMLILERGGINFKHALRRLAWGCPEELERAAQADACILRASIRMMVIVLVAGTWRRILRVASAAFEPAPQVGLDAGATAILQLAERFASASGRSDISSREKVNVGDLLLALASSPGRHLRLLDNPTLLACAVRRKLGLAVWHHRLVLACDGVNLRTRRLRMRLDREVALHGHRSPWGAAWAADCLAGILLATLVFPVTVLANVLLYVFLWPAGFLMAGMRAACGMSAGCRTTNLRWHQIPGGEAALVDIEKRVAGGRVAAVFLLPRILAFLCSVAALTVVLWRTQRLDVAMLPTLFARPDIATGAARESLWLAPATLLSDVLKQNGALAGIGLLAGLGVGLMSLPTYHELSLIRLYAGHEVGFGSRLARALTLPASILAGGIACVETVLPLRNGPIYLTVYIVPVVFSALLATAIVSILPY